MANETDPVVTARKAVDALLAAGADKARASVSRKRLSELNVDSGKMSLYRSTADVSLALLALDGSRKGAVSVYSLPTCLSRWATPWSICSREEPTPLFSTGWTRLKKKP